MGEERWGEVTGEAGVGWTREGLYCGIRGNRRAGREVQCRLANGCKGDRNGW